MSGHTPGPWVCREAAPNWEIFNEQESRWVAYATKTAVESEQIGFYPTLAESEANARLIAAAPELLEYLQTAVAIIKRSKGFWVGIDGAEAAIAKATGGAA